MVGSVVHPGLAIGTGGVVDQDMRLPPVQYEILVFAWGCHRSVAESSHVGERCNEPQEGATGRGLPSAPRLAPEYLVDAATGEAREPRQLGNRNLVCIPAFDQVDQRGVEFRSGLGDDLALLTVGAYFVVNSHTLSVARYTQLTSCVTRCTFSSIQAPQPEGPA